MAYSEKDGQVVLTMSPDDYDRLLLCLGAAATSPLLNVGGFSGVTSLLNRLNQGNPDWMPYEVEEKKC